MSIEQNKATSRRWYLEIFNQGKLEVADEIHTAAYINYDPYAPPGGFGQGPAATKNVVALYRGAFPDVHFTIEDQIAEGDKVVTRWTARGTNAGSLNGVPPTGRKAAVGGISVERFDQGKLAETRVSFDMFGLLQQLGVVPAQVAPSETVLPMARRGGVTINAEAIRAVLEAARWHYNVGDMQTYVATLYAADAVAHYLPPGLPQGHAGLLPFYNAMLDAFPDEQLVFDDVVVESDRAAIRFHMDMTHQGNFNGIPATGKRVKLTGTTTMRFVGDKVVERWSETDYLGLMQQLGVVESEQVSG